MYKQKNIFKFIAAFLCAVLIVTSVNYKNTIKADAAGSSLNNLLQVFDVALSKAGLHANESLISSFVERIQDGLFTKKQSYEAYCASNGLDSTVYGQQWLQWFNSNNNSTDLRTLGNIVNSAFLGNYTGIDLFSNTAILTALIGTSNPKSGETYTLSTDVVNNVMEDFYNMYYYGSTIPPVYYEYVYSYNNPFVQSMFSDDTSHVAFMEYVLGGSCPTLVGARYGLMEYQKASGYWVFDNREEYNIVRPYNLSGSEYMYFYDNDLNSKNVRRGVMNVDSEGFPYTDFELGSKVYNSANEDVKLINTIGYFNPRNNASYERYYYYFVGLQEGFILVFSDYEALSSFYKGNSPLYCANVPYGDDMSVTVSGDYMINNGTLSYDTISNQVANNNDYSQHTVQEIVDSYNSTIINNYYGTGSDSGDDNNSENSGSGLGSLIDGIGDLLNFFVKLIGDLIGLIATALDSVYELLQGLGGSFSNFALLLGDLFVFIPDELIKFLSASIMAAVVICLWKLLKR